MKTTPVLSQALSDKKLPDLNLPEILAISISNGGELAELFFETTESTRVVFEDGKLDQALEGQDRGVGLRVFFDQRQVYGYTTDLTQGSLEKLARDLSLAVLERRKEKTASAPVGSSSGLADQKIDVSKIDWRLSQVQKNASNPISQYQVKRSPRGVAIGEKIALVKRAEASARATLPDARQIFAVMMDSQRSILTVNTDGTIAPDEKILTQMVIEVVGEKNGKVEMAHESDGGFVGMEFFDEHTPESFGKKAAEKVKLLLGAVPAPSGTLTVVLSSEAGGTMIHEAVGHGLEADLACNQLSVYGGKLGAQVASPLITVKDDGTMAARRGSYRFDDEGNPSKENTLIENGVLKSYMVDRLSAMKFDLMATGNGRRESFRHKPIVRMTNTYIAPGKDNPADILKDTKSGIFVKGMGGGQVNTVTGDFVFAVTEAYLIEDGKLGRAIRGATLVGNGPKVLKEVDRVGTDLGFATGTCGKDGQGAPVTDAQPTLRIPNLTVGGEVPVSTYFKA